MLVMEKRSGWEREEELPSHFQPWFTSLLWRYEDIEKWPTSQVKKAWEWGHKCRRSGALSFSVRGKQWEGGLQGPTKGPPYEKKKGENRRQSAPPPHSTPSFIQTWTRKGSLKAVEMGCINMRFFFIINLLLFLPSWGLKIMLNLVRGFV